MIYITGMKTFTEMMMTEFQLFFYGIAGLLFLILIFSWIDAKTYKRKMNQVIVRLDELIEIAREKESQL